MKKLSLVILLASISCGGGNESAPPAASPSATPAAASAAPPADPAAPAASAAPASSAAPAASAPSTASPSGADAPLAWKDMTKQQRGKFMRETVMPKMKELFTAHDAKKFEKLNCATCHGSGAADGSFKMPNAQLPVLPATAEGFEALGKKHPAMMKFMAMQVKPEMAKLLGEKEMDPKNPQAGGFGCMNCHTMKK